MRLPDIDPASLPDHVQAMIDQGAEWQSLHEEDFLIRMPVSDIQAERQKREAQVMLLAYRKYTEKTQEILKRLEKRLITEDEAKQLLSEAHKVIDILRENQKKHINKSRNVTN